MAKPTGQRAGGVTVKTEHGSAKVGKIVTEDLKMSSYDKVQHKLSKMQGTVKEGGVKRQAKAVTKSNAKGTLGSKNSRKRS